MATTTALRAAKKFGPGYFIREQMELRNWTQEDLAEVMGITVKHLNKILQDRQPLTLDMARILGETFNTSPQYWVNLDTGYRLWLASARSDKEQEADIKAAIYERMPVKDMMSKGWLKRTQLVAALKQQVLDFWGWDTLDFSIIDQQYLPCLTRRSSAYNQYNASYAITWYRKAQQVGENMARQPYNRKQLEQLYDQLYLYTTLDNGINRFLEKLTAAGVIFFVLPHLQKTYLDGAAFLSGNNPVVVYTGRYRRLDHFWFTIAHEIAHILLHLGKDTPFVLDNLRSEESNDMEEEANALAAEKLRHPQVMDELSPYVGYLSVRRVEECAAKYEIHPAIIIGKLAHEKKISYSNQALFNEDVMKYIEDKYLF